MVRVPFTVRHLCLPCSILLSEVIEALLRCGQETAWTSSTIYIDRYGYGYRYIDIDIDIDMDRDIDMDI